jgi:hypothetical protein
MIDLEYVVTIKLAAMLARISVKTEESRFQ